MATGISEAAGRYAEAVFDLGAESGALDTLENDFAILTSAFAQSADLRLAAQSPLIDPAEKARALAEVAARIGVSPLGSKLVGTAAQNGRAAELPQIAQAFQARLARHRGARQVEIVSAAALSPQEEAELIAEVGKALGAKIEATVRVDERLLGGFVVRAGSRQFDASLKSKLESLRLALRA